MTAKQTIEAGKAILGIEFGSTRIKAVLIDQENKPIAQGSHEWENQLVDGLWTYSIEAIWYGLQDCYAELRKDVQKQYDCEIESLAAIGFSAMMHGYMAFNEQQQILVPFRTWRNTNTGKAAAELSKLFNYNIPLRWSISHLYEAILDNEEHVADIKYLTTLAGYVHWQVTGQFVLGVGDAAHVAAAPLHVAAAARLPARPLALVHADQLPHACLAPSMEAPHACPQDFIVPSSIPRLQPFPLPTATGHGNIA